MNIGNAQQRPAESPVVSAPAPPTHWSTPQPAPARPDIIQVAVIQAAVLPTPQPAAVPLPQAVPVAAPEPEIPAAQRPGLPLRQWIAANLRVGQVACWQVAFALAGLAITRPWPVGAVAALGAFVLLALTVVRLRERWLYEWTVRWLRFRLREHERYLPREGASRALLHLLAPDATVITIEVGNDNVAVVSRLSGATAVLRPTDPDVDPVAVLPRLESLLPVNDDTFALGVQLVFHGVAGQRRTPLAWIAVQALRTPDLVEEEELAQALHNVLRRVLRQLARSDIVVAGLDEAALMHTVASLAHVSDRRGEVSEQWRTWCCGSVVQAGFRLLGWADQDDADARSLLRGLLTANTGAVVTIAVAAGVTEGVPAPEVATMRVAAPGAAELERSVQRLRELAARRAIRLDRMDGQQAEAIAASLPLGS